MEKRKFEVEDIDNIDLLSLGQEWLKQPAMYRYFATKAEEATGDADKSESDLKVIDAEIEKEIRHNADMNDTKITEKAVASEILLNDKHKKAVEAALQARHEARVLGAVVRTLDHRKKALEKLVDLELNGYNSTPKEPRQMKQTFREKELEKKSYDKLNKKRSK